MKNEQTILLLDDEVLALSYLKDTIDDVIKTSPNFSSFKLIGTTNQTEFWLMIQKHLPKIIFLDIQMPGKSGLEIANEIRTRGKELGYPNEQLPIIIFITAYENYGYQAYKVAALDYVLKPIMEEDILNVFKKIESQHESVLKEIEDTIIVPSSGIDIEIPIKEVLYFKADMKYIAVVTSKKEFLINSTLLTLQERYSKFVKIHRAYLVNPIYVHKFYKKNGHTFLMLKNHDIHLPVSRRQKQDLEGKLDYNTIFNELFDNNSV